MKTLETLAAIWRDAGLPEAALDQVSLPTSPPIYPSAHAVGPAAQSSIAAMALAVAEILYLRDGQRAAVSVDRRHALAEFRSEHLLRLDGVASASLWDEIAGPYPCGDGRWIRIHTNFPHHRDGILKLLGCAYSREAVAAALRGWTAEAFEEAARLRSGIIYVSLSAYGEKGPWSGRRGFDSIAQTAIGINQAEAAAFGLEGPKALPCQSLDHASGYLMAFGALAGLRRRALEGGSWHVQVSLARTGHWLQDLGLSSSALDVAEPAREAFADLLEEYASGFGTFSAIRHAGLIEGHAPRWDQPTMPLGSHPPHWL